MKAATLLRRDAPLPDDKFSAIADCGKPDLPISIDVIQCHGLADILSSTGRR